MKRYLLALLMLVGAGAQCAGFLGTFPEDAEVVFYWNTFDDDGASVTRATDGTVKVIRDDQTDCTGTSVTDTEDSLATGVHLCKVDTSDGVNYAVGYTYFVWIDGAVVDGDTVNAVIATFSIEDRYVNVAEIEGADPTDTIRDSVVDDATRVDASALNTLSGHDPGANLGTGTSTHSAADVYTAFGTGGNLTTCATATGFSTHSAADVWAVATRQLTGTQTFNLTGNITGNLSGSVGSLTTWHASVTDWGDGERLDLILDIIAADVLNLDGDAMRGTDSAALAATALSTATWTAEKAGFLDVAISSRGTGTALDAAGVAAAVWNAATVTYGAAGSYGLLLETDLDAAISSRAASATALSNATWTDAKAGYLTAAVATATALATSDGKLDTLSTRLSAARAGYLDNLSAGAVALAATALSNATWTDAKAGYLTGAVATAAALTTVGDNVVLILADTGELQTDWHDGGRLDLLLDASGDPWSTALPGAYGAGTAGYIVGTYVDAAISGIAAVVGAGATPYTLTITTGAGAPVGEVRTWVTTDAAGTNVTAGPVSTADDGTVTFYLDSGVTYYRWCKKGGYTFTNPKEFTVP